MKKFNILNSFQMKIIAMVTMTLDHIAVVIASFWGLTMSNPAYATLRIIGRFAMPLYCFMIVEGVIHTKKYKNYFLKLSILAIIISSFLAFSQYGPVLELRSITGFGNIFMDLALGSLLIYTLNHKNKYIKLIAIIPLALAILSFSAKCYEYFESCHIPGCDYRITVDWYPKFLRFQYDWLSLGLMLGYYFSRVLAKVYFKFREEAFNIPIESVEDNDYRIASNIIAVFFTMLFAFLYYAFKYINPDIVWWDANMQLGMLLASLVIILYNGNRGYNKKWFNIFSYLYYPMHIILIYAICYLIYIL